MGTRPLREDFVSPYSKWWFLALSLVSLLLTRRKMAPRTTMALTVCRLELPVMDAPRVRRIRLPHLTRRTWPTVMSEFKRLYF